MLGWKIETCTDRGPRHFYRFRVCGWNRYTGEAFAWDVPTDPRTENYGYDLLNAYFRVAPCGSLDLSERNGGVRGTFASRY
jgi:hypothetical protein